MLFNSLAFALFFVLFQGAYWALNGLSGAGPAWRLRARNVLILVGSYVFYGWWDWRFLGLIALSTLVDFHSGRSIHGSDDDAVRRRWLWTSVVVNLGILGIFKYFGFFVDGAVDLLAALGLGANRPALDIVLPVGISFYTFQTLTYTIDIYRRQLKPTDNFVDFAAFVAFFPQLVAGPIERASALLPQIGRLARADAGQVADGLWLMLWGLTKKVLVADRLAAYADVVYAAPDAATPLQALVATGCFAIQIYADFSGYSDIARGVAKTLGFELMVNFETPYLATSLQQFWQRWHISLSTWFRDYLYIPLGGSRVGVWAHRRNIVTTFVVSGIWHGANDTFAIWGLIHGLGYLLDPLQRWRTVRPVPRWVVGAGLLQTMLLVNLAWVFFRAASLGDALTIVGRILAVPLSLASPGPLVVGMANTEFLLGVLLAGQVLVLDAWIARDQIDIKVRGLPWPVRWGLSWWLLVQLLLLRPASTGAFIYFQF